MSKVNVRNLTKASLDVFLAEITPRDSTAVAKLFHEDGAELCGLRGGWERNG
jgi:hypothetical protein